MIKFENTEVLGWDHAIRGMRNPMNSWDKSDSFVCKESDPICRNYCSLKDNGCGVMNCGDFFAIGQNDYNLMKRLREAGTDHRKFMRMITVYVDITAPLYWWKEFDTYKVGTVANSCSTMHKIHAKEFTLDDFSHEHLIGFYAGDRKVDENDIPHVHATVDCMYSPLGLLTLNLEMLNNCRERYLAALKTEDECGIQAKDIWWQMIQLLPSSYNQKRTVMLNYEVLANIYKSRKAHKLDEWRVGFCNWIKSLPYSELITGEFDNG